MRSTASIAAIVAAALSAALLACTRRPAGTATSTTRQAAAAGAARSATPATPGGSAGPVTMADARACPVTIGHPVPPTKHWRESLFGWQSAYGNRALWVGALWPHGVVFITPDDVDSSGALQMKFGWYRLTFGSLSITGRRLDASVPPASGHAANYGLIGFAASGVTFPTEGCWRVTGRVGRTALSFVTFVIKGRCDRNTTPVRCVADRARPD